MTTNVTPIHGGDAPVITLDNINYNVIDGPGEDTPLVQVSKEQVLQTIKIDKMVRNLNMTDKLLHVAACGVAGFMSQDKKTSLSAEVQNLQFKLRKATGNMASSLYLFETNASTMLPVLKKAFRDIYALREGDAIERLKSCAKIATSLEATASKLETDWQELADQAQSVATKTTTARDEHEGARRDAEIRYQAIVAKNAETQAIRENLKTRIPEIQKLYEDAKAAQATADTRMFTLAIVGGVTKAVGSAITAGLQFKAAPAVAGSQLAAALAETAVKKPKKAAKKAKNREDDEEEESEEDNEGSDGAAVTDKASAAKAEYKKAKAAREKAEKEHKKAKNKHYQTKTKSDQLKEDRDNAKSEWETANKKKVKDKDDIKEKKATYNDLMKKYNAAASALEDAETAVTEAKQALDDATENEAAAKKAVASAPSRSGDTATAMAAATGAGLKSAGQSSEDMAANYATIASNYAAEKSKYLDLLLSLQKEERVALGAIARFAEEMKTEKSNEELEKAAVESLHIAAGVLKRIVVILSDIKVFWTEMAAACKKLASSAITEDLEIQKKYPEAERRAEYSAVEFKMGLLKVAGQWVALKLISGEYHIATKAVFSTMGETYADHPDIQAARAKAKVLAAKLLPEVNTAITDSVQTENLIREEKRETSALIENAA